jgi:hypothetical protein
MTLIALQWTDIRWAVLLAVVLAVGLLVPYLIREIKEGKRELGPLRRLRGGRVELGPQTPVGAGDRNPGRVGDPAPGQPSGQPDPYSEQARRHAPPIKS